MDPKSGQMDGETDKDYKDRMDRYEESLQQERDDIAKEHETERITDDPYFGDKN